MHNNFLPGASTVYFDDVVKERIYDSINSGRISQLKEYRTSYELVKYKIGKTPLMMDFVKLGDKDPYIFVLKDGSYFLFKQHVDKGETTLNALHEKLLKFLGTEVCNGKRLEEVVVLKLLLGKGIVYFENVIADLKKDYHLSTNIENIKGALNVLSMNFFKDADAKKYGNIALAVVENNKISLGAEFANCLNNPEFRM